MTKQLPPATLEDVNAVQPRPANSPHGGAPAAPRMLLGIALLGASVVAGCDTEGAAGEDIDLFAQDLEDLVQARGPKAKHRVCFKDTLYYVNEAQRDQLIRRGGYAGACDIFANRLSLGDGYIQSLVQLDEDGAPVALGVQLDEAAMATLPTEAHDGATCWDYNEDGVTDPLAGECSGGHERVLFYPKIPGLPFKFVQFNWQTHGHAPAHVFDQPHFDLHIFIQDYISRNFIRTGPCPTHINCDDLERALKEVPYPYMPTGWSAPNAAAGRMGNHLLDLEDPLYDGHGDTLDQTFAFGAYDGHITFYEPLVVTAWLASKPSESCKPIPQPPAVEVSGYYPRKYCSRYRADRKDYTMTMEDFWYRKSPADGGEILDEEVTEDQDAGAGGHHDHEVTP